MVAQTEIEKVLDVFSQTKYKAIGKYFSEFTGDMSDPRVARLVKRLQKGILDGDLLHAMYVEDEIESMLEENLKELEEANERVNKANERANKANEKANVAVDRANKADSEVDRLNQQVAALLAQISVTNSGGSFPTAL